MNGKLGELLAKTLPPMGYELVDWEMSRGRMVRVFIDKPAGVDVDDCARVSSHLTRLFTVENIDYERLEPGPLLPCRAGMGRVTDGERTAHRPGRVRWAANPR